MIVGQRVRALREEKKLSQGDIEERAGLLRCYLSRVENGRTIPSIQTLTRIAVALEVPLYRMFYNGEKPPEQMPIAPKTELWGESGEEARLLATFCRCLSRMRERDQELLLSLARKMALRKSNKVPD